MGRIFKSKLVSNALTANLVLRLAAVDRRQKARQQEMLASAKNNYALAERVFISNPSMFSAYLAAVRTYGESGARVRLTEETSRLLQQQPELACAP